MRYWVEEYCDWDDECSLWELVMVFEFEEDAEAWIRNKCKKEHIPVDNFRIIDLKTNDKKYLDHASKSG